MNQNILKVDFGYVKFEKGDYFIKLGKRKDNKLIPQIKHCQKLIKNMKKMQKYQKKSYYNREIRLICPKSRTLQLNYNDRSEEHTSELQSRFDIVYRLLHEK